METIQVTAKNNKWLQELEFKPSFKLNHANVTDFKLIYGDVTSKFCVNFEIFLMYI